MSELTDLALRALDNCRQSDVEYADIRTVSTRHESIDVKDGRVGALAQGRSHGLGLRLRCGGSWSFAATDDLTAAGVDDMARRALDLARASARVAAAGSPWAGAEPVDATWATPHIIDPFAVPLDAKISHLLAADERMRGIAGVTTTRAGMQFCHEQKGFYSSEGHRITQDLRWGGLGIEAIASDDDDSQVRSWPNSYGGQFEAGGYEMVERWRLLEEAARVGDEAVALLRAPQCPAATATLIITGSQVGLQVHESAGHATELDRALGSEANYAGTSFLLPSMLGTFQYGSPLVHITADATAPGGLGTFGFDDEGTPAQRYDLVSGGLFSGYLTSRDTAPTIGLARSQGCMRAAGWNRLPLIRMTNINLEPGQGSLDDLLADVDDGYLMDTNRSWSIDDQRRNFQFGVEATWEIRRGRRVRLLKHGTYRGVTPTFWASCDAVAGPREWVLWGVPNCGKGEPGQVIGTGHGAAPARFRNVSIGLEA